MGPALKGGLSFVPALNVRAGGIPDPWISHESPHTKGQVMHLPSLVRSRRAPQSRVSVFRPSLEPLESRCLLSATLTPIPPPGENLSHYSIIDLGTLGGTDATPTGMNDRSQVVGLSTTVTGDTHAFLWQVGHMTDLGTLGGTFSEAYIINAEGEVAGGATTPGGDEHPVVWKDGHMIDLLPNAPAGEGGLATAVNDRGQVVGQLYFPDGSGHAFYYDPRVGLIDVHGQVTLGGNVDAFWDINNRGQMVGLSATPDGDSHAILFDASGLHDLGTLVGTWSEASSINEAGQISGNAGYDPTQHCPAMPMALCTDQFINSHAFLYADGVMHDLGAVPGATWSQGTWVDGQGRVFGGSIEFPTDPGAPEDGKASATLWDHGTVTDLNTLLDNPPPTLYPNNLGTVEWGNSHGQLVAWGVLAGTDPDEEFHNHAFLLTPVPSWGELDAQDGLHADASNDQGAKLGDSGKSGWAAENLGGIGWNAADAVFALLADEPPCRVIPDHSTLRPFTGSGGRDEASKWYEQATEWLEKNGQRLKSVPGEAEEFRRIQSEAAEVLQVEEEVTSFCP
jgi:probable HAF family extracellular repeat protein